MGNFRFFADFSAKKCFLPQKSPYNAVFFRRRLWKILLKFPAVLWVFSPKPIFSTQSRTKFPTIAGNFVEKSKGRRYGAGDRRVAPALCGRKSGLFRKPSRRLDPSFVSRCISKSYVNITKVMRNTNSDHRNSYFAGTPAAGATIGIRVSRERPPQARPSEFVFRGNCGAARRDHRNPYFTGTPAARRDYRNSYFAATAAPQGVTIGIRFHGKRSPQGAQGRRAQKRQAFTACLFLFFRNALILREARAYLRDRTDTLPDSKRRRRHRCSTCCRPC